jgi:hypothetical protein
MRSKPVSLKLPQKLYEASREKAAQEYPSYNAYVTWLIFYDMLVHKPHHITAPLARAHVDDQDKLIDEVVDAYQQGRNLHGSWFENKVRKALAELESAGQMEFSQILKAVAQRAL